MVLPIPIKQLFSIVQPSKTALGPIRTLSPITVLEFFLGIIYTKSYKSEFFPIKIWPKSPLKVDPYQIELS